MNAGDLIGMAICFGIIAIGALVAALKCAYAAGWNASVQYHMKRDKMDPIWRTYV